MNTKMERKITQMLLQWKDGKLPGSPMRGRMPVLLGGARQVGKTWAALDFGEANYSDVAYVNLEASKDAAQIFDGDLEPTRITRLLSALTGHNIVEGTTLLVLDEIQACQRALTSLKYFAESGLDYHVLGTGSLLGVAVNRQEVSFPVGKVHQLQMYPLDFEEYLWARGKRELAQLIRESQVSLQPLALHETALAAYYEYLAVGGMPQVVADFAARGDFNFALAIQQGIESAFVADMAKYSTAGETAKALAAWKSIPGQLAKENHRFKYRGIQEGARSRTYESAIDWLQAAGLVAKCELVEAGRVPLAARVDSTAFKLYLLDTGLLVSKSSLPPNQVALGLDKLGGWAGSLVENAVSNALSASGIANYFWASKGTAEVDFVAQDAQAEVIPIEVKAGDNVRARSLARFRELYDPPYAIRLSAKNFGERDQLISMPLYASFLLGEQLGWAR
ncbi:MAG: ATP-binding protein [Propionibacteriaceae bacterium]|jgi:predicted AAA+ superfamily ATPase|nr:ATP-binding protein [Propionibacteriaceae bacterium]